MCVVVQDQGIGIPREHLPRIFERFYTIGTSDHEHRVGMGIGLFMVKEIVTLHGGTVDVHSEVGKGSIFTITLPSANSSDLTNSATATTG